MKDIIGHQKVLDFFAKVNSGGNLSHAYCFVGPEQVGKKAVAKALAVQLLEVEQERLVSNPDFFSIKRGINEKTGKTRKDIIIDQIRDLKGHLANRSYLGKYKVAIIDQANKMNKEAGNALLKTLEEPSADTVLFLLTKDEGLLPDTIVSRCQLIYFHPVKTQVLQDWLVGSGISESKARDMALLAQGLPGRAKRWLSDDEEYKWYRAEIDRWESLIGQPFFAKLKVINELFGDKTDHIATRHQLQKVLSIWQLLVRDQMYYKLGMDEQVVAGQGRAGEWSDNGLKVVEEGIRHAKEMLNKNIHPKLLVESILLNIP